MTGKSRMRELLPSWRGCAPPTAVPGTGSRPSRPLRPITIEEAYEVADAIERGDMPHLKDELGDLLFQVVFHAQIASEAEQFDFEAVAGSDLRQTACAVIRMCSAQRRIT